MIVKERFSSDISDLSIKFQQFHKEMKKQAMLGVKKFKKKEFDQIFEVYRDQAFDFSKKDAQIKHLKANIKQLH